MPNAYDLKATKGALALARRWEPNPNEPTRPPLGGGGTRAGRPGVSTAGRIQKTWSARSRRRMRFEFGALPWELLGKRPVMVTLTYPPEWELWVPDARALHRHREALKERWRRRYGTPMGVWVTEFQRRGAPHLHMYLALPDEVSDEEYVGLRRRTIRRKILERKLGRHDARRRVRAPQGEFSMWLRTAWWDIVGSELRAHHGRGVDIATAFFSEQAEEQANRTRVAEYFWRESGKWAQKIPPEGFGGMRFYGRWGNKQGFTPLVSTTELNEAVGLELRRMMRRMMRGKMQEAATRTGRPVPRNAGRSRGRDGLTVFGVDGTIWGPRLRECAERIALEKAERRSDEERQVLRSRRTSPRALSELRIDIDAVVEEQIEARRVQDDYPEPPLSWEEEQDLAIEAAIEAIELEEAAEQAAQDAWIEEEVRKLRRAELRRAGGWAGAPGRQTRSGGRRRP